MSSLSPRASISGASSAEVAADFEESLKDLTANNRYEITNLTIIAKENTEYAQAISKVLENHIKTTQPTRKLPALYVLDSIVKNVGTPYTVYLGRNLYSTFMDAYTMVDAATRRQMESMLKTWKIGVPGSIDPRPVFPEVTWRPIENALIKARTAVLQSQRQVQPQNAYQGTSTPPQHNGQFFPPPVQQAQHPFSGYGSQQPTPQPQQYQYPPPNQTPPSDIESVKRDIAALISRDQTAFASNVGDQSLRTRLYALLDLQKYLNVHSCTGADLQAIKLQVAQLAQAAPPLPQQIQPPATPVPQWTPPAPVPPVRQVIQSPFPQQPPPSLSGPPMLTPEALSGLQALLSTTQKPGTPQMRAAMPVLGNASHSQLNAIQHHTATTSASGPADLIASLTKAGLINPVSAMATSAPSMAQSTAPPTAPPNVSLSMDATASLMKSIQSVLTPQQRGGPIQASRMPKIATLPISSASLKTFQSDLVVSLYDALPNQCNTCGRRFLSTEEGRANKIRHLDWHFRTNQRIADPNTNRGHHRNWYMNEMEWISHKDFDPSTASTNTVDPKSVAKPKKETQEQFVRAPEGVLKNKCNICFEEMNSSYVPNLSDWFFQNATMHNKKIVHATCLAEMTKANQGNGGSSLAAVFGMEDGKRARSATPDSLLGKRKADTVMTGSGARIKMS